MSHIEYISERRERPKLSKRNKRLAQERANEHAQKARRKLNRERKQTNIRNKYGPKRQPSKVTVKSLATGQTLSEHDQSHFNKQVYAESLEKAARAAGYKDYATYLRSPHWQRLRNRVLARDQHRCQRCRGRVELQVHHNHYGNLASNDIRKLSTLCKWCHQAIHDAHQ